MRWYTRLLAVVWVLLGLLLVYSSVAGCFTSGDGALFLALIVTCLIGVVVFLLPGALLLAGKKMGWYVLATASAGMFLYSACYVLGDLQRMPEEYPGEYRRMLLSSTELQATIVSAVCVALLATDRPSRWRRREDQ